MRGRSGRQYMFHELDGMSAMEVQRNAASSEIAGLRHGREHVGHHLPVGKRVLSLVLGHQGRHLEHEDVLRLEKLAVAPEMTGPVAAVAHIVAARLVVWVPGKHAAGRARVRRPDHRGAT